MAGNQKRHLCWLLRFNLLQDKPYRDTNRDVFRPSEQRGTESTITAQHGSAGCRAACLITNYGYPLCIYNTLTNTLKNLLSGLIHVYKNFKKKTINSLLFSKSFHIKVEQINYFYFTCLVIISNCQSDSGRASTMKQMSGICLWRLLFKNASCLAVSSFFWHFQNKYVVTDSE